MKRLKIILAFSALLFSCKPDNSAYYMDNNPYKKFDSYAEFQTTITDLASINKSATRDSLINLFIDSLRSNQEIPFAKDTSVMFIYYGKAKNVAFTGDFNQWTINDKKYEAKKLRGADLWILEQNFPDDARFDYKVSVNKGELILDPLNNRVQNNILGPNSELRMPYWEVSKYSLEKTDIPKGTLTNTQTILSNETNLDYKINYQVYLPHDYQNQKNLPVIYVTDGHEYANPLLGNMITVLDNMIANNVIKPLIAVFIDPRNPENLEENRSVSEYDCNDRFVDFIIHELVPEIDKSYKTDPQPESRAILGTSYGGRISTYIGVKKSEIFGCIAAQSPVLDENLIREYGKVKKLPIKFYLSCGTFYDVKENSQLLRDVLIYKGYPLEYIEVNESNSWGAWRNQIDIILKHFFKID
ncbi:MAG TPA: alpha/beta hydrolase-fold protein [Salinivirgaceae bacterium]|nr:alpha/beta hydrolase-fold protein [Salinivirgaceae bacterium]